MLFLSLTHVIFPPSLTHLAYSVRQSQSVVGIAHLYSDRNFISVASTGCWKSQEALMWWVGSFYKADAFPNSDFYYMNKTTECILHLYWNKTKYLLSLSIINPNIKHLSLIIR